MRRKTTNEVVAGIGLLLAGSATLFAWVAGRPGTPPRAIAAVGDEDLVEPARDQEADRRRAQEFAWKEIGSLVYDAECVNCHGQGERRRRTPPLIGHVPELYATPGGHAHLIDFLLFGMEGRFDVRGESYAARHPAFANRLSNNECAAVLNQMLVSWGNERLLPVGADLYHPKDVLRHRHYQFTPAEVSRWRQRIGEANPEAAE